VFVLCRVNPPAQYFLTCRNEVSTETIWPLDQSDDQKVVLAKKEPKRRTATDMPRQMHPSLRRSWLGTGHLWIVNVQQYMAVGRIRGD
jgi:hypothetical protein